MENSVSVILPDGKKVDAPTTPQPWWSMDGGTGYIDPHLLAPNPNQPRDDMNSAKLEELQDSVAERGVREPVAVTPRELAPWIILPPEQAMLPFITVSGHRRTQTALNASVPAVPIRVIVYASQVDFEMDTSILNKGRDDLTPLQQGKEILRLRDLGVPIEKLVKAFGYKSAPSLYLRINLTRLDPKIQALLDTSLPTKEQLPPTTGGHLGGIGVPTVKELEELCIIFKSEIQATQLFKMVIYADLCTLEDDARRFEMQKMLLSVIVHRRLSVARSIDFIAEHKLNLASTENSGKGRQSGRFEPRKRKEVLKNLGSMVTDSTVIDWTPEEYERIFEDSTVAEVEKYRLDIHHAQSLLADTALMLQRIVEDKKAKESQVVSFSRRKA